MPSIFEYFGLKKNKIEVGVQESKREKEIKLQNLINQYKDDQHRIKNISQSYLGTGHQADVSEMGTLNFVSAQTKKRILELAGQVGQDGNNLIALADEEIKQEREKPEH